MVFVLVLTVFLQCYQVTRPYHPFLKLFLVVIVNYELSLTSMVPGNINIDSVPNILRILDATIVSFMGA